MYLSSYVSIYVMLRSYEALQKTNRISFLSYFEGSIVRRHPPPRRRRPGRGETARRELRSRPFLHATVFATRDYLLRPGAELGDTRRWTCWSLSLMFVLFWSSAWGGGASRGRTYLSVAARVVVVIGEHVHVGSVAATAAARCPHTRARAPSPWCESLRHRAAPPAIAAALPPPPAAAAATR